MSNDSTPNNVYDFRNWRPIRTDDFISKLMILMTSEMGTANIVAVDEDRIAIVTDVYVGNPGGEQDGTEPYLSVMTTSDGKNLCFERTDVEATWLNHS